LAHDPPRLLLSAALMYGLGFEAAAWRVRAGAATDYLSPDLYTELAQAGERGKLHAVFLAEQMTNTDSGTSRPAGAMDTAAVLAHMAAVTEHVGLVGTGSTTYNQPYDLARRFSTLDHLARGRIGWNAVTTANPATAEMFGGSGIDEHPDAAVRYARADEFIDVVSQLWASWDDGAIVGDKARGISPGPNASTTLTTSASSSPFADRCRSLVLPKGAQSSSTPGRRPPGAIRPPALPTSSSPPSTRRPARWNSARTSAAAPLPTAVTPTWSRCCRGWRSSSAAPRPRPGPRRKRWRKRCRWSARSPT
jgi:alkanesulfonate monooxygenase SsuD/methylene tetrahydromethanopterin reductase-like flavin-dependent oxidoreductase (luciferase family)